MLYLKRFLLVLLLTLTLIFLGQNQSVLGQEIAFRFFKYQFSLNLGLWLLISVLAGILGWLLIELTTIFQLKRDIRRLNQEMHKQKLELEEARKNIHGAAPNESIPLGFPDTLPDSE